MGVKLFMVIKVVGKFCNSQKILESVRVVALTLSLPFSLQENSLYSSVVILGQIFFSFGLRY